MCTTKMTKSPQKEDASGDVPELGDPIPGKGDGNSYGGGEGDSKISLNRAETGRRKISGIIPWKRWNLTAECYLNNWLRFK